MNLAWLESGNYLVDIDAMRTNIMKNAMIAKTESEVASIFQSELYYYIRKNTGVEPNFHPETPIKGGISHNFGSLKKRTSGKGRLDAIVNNLIIEYKKHGKIETLNDQKTAINQVIDYLITLYQNEGLKYSAILTDGIKICYFSFNEDIVEHSMIATIEAKDIDKIIRAILLNESKQFVPENILKDFSVNHLTDTPSKKLAIELYKNLTQNPSQKTDMLFQEWENLMHLSFDDNGKGNDIAKRRRDLSLIFSEHIDSADKEYKSLFALQTAYAIIIKLIACKIIDKLEFGSTTKTYFDLTNVSSIDLQNFLEQVENGYVYRCSNIINLLEGDFFSWYTDEKQWNAEHWKLILEIIKCIDEYSLFSFDISYKPVDIFKDLYMSIIPKSVRHSMGEYFTPGWLADYVVTEGLKLQSNDEWRAIDPCCGSGTFVIQLIKHIVGNVNLYTLSEEEKAKIKDNILRRVFGIDINPLSVLSARIGYYLALKPFGDFGDFEIPIYLGDSAITPTKALIDNIPCYRYSVVNNKKSFDVILPERLVNLKDFGKIMFSLQTAVNTNDANILYMIICNHLTEEELLSDELQNTMVQLSKDLVDLHQNKWDGIWVRIATNFMLIARLKEFDFIVGNPPWVKWEHLPSRYAEKIKELCNIKHIFSARGRFGGTQLNICALISNVVATNWLRQGGVLAFLMPDSIMSQNSYEEFRYFYIDYKANKRLFLQKIDKWEKPLRPFRCEDKVVSQDFITYYYSNKIVDYSKGIDVITISRKNDVTDDFINKQHSFDFAKKYLLFGKKRAAQMSSKSSSFSYLSDKFDFSKIIGDSSYEYRTGVEFTPQELYMLVGDGISKNDQHYIFINKKFQRSKYIVNDMPKNGWDLPTKYIYPILTGPAISPFKYEDRNEFCILPYTKLNTTTPVSAKEMLDGNKKLFDYLLNHQALINSQSEKSKAMHRGEEFYALSKVGPYTFSEYIVAARDNTNFCATVIKPTITPWGERKHRICVKHTMIIGRDIEKNELTEEEAYYISGILNSSIIVEYMHNTFKSNGYSLKKSNFYLPKYDPQNIVHKRISDISKMVSDGIYKDINAIQELLTQLYLELCSDNSENI